MGPFCGAMEGRGRGEEAVGKGEEAEGREEEEGRGSRGEEVKGREMKQRREGGCHTTRFRSVGRRWHRVVQRSKGMHAKVCNVRTLKASLGYAIVTDATGG